MNLDELLERLVRGGLHRKTNTYLSCDDFSPVSKSMTVVSPLQSAKACFFAIIGFPHVLSSSPAMTRTMVSEYQLVGSGLNRHLSVPSWYTFSVGSEFRSYTVEDPSCI